MKKLIICDTLYQIIVAIQMKLTILKNDEVTVIITDHSNGTEAISYRLRQIDLFKDVIYVKDKSIVYPKNRFMAILNIISVGFFNHTYIDIDKYDEIIFYGKDVFTYSIANQQEKFKVLWSRYEEGLFSYETDVCTSKTVRLLEIISNCIGKDSITETIRTYYCFFPEFKMNPNRLELIRIPILNTNLNEIKPILKRVFNFNKNRINEKFIYFASSSDIDGRPYGETELVIKLAEMLGKENFIVKIHPRDKRTIYRDLNIHVFEDVDIPWEVYQLCSDMEGKTLLTADSGAFISVTAIYPQNIEGYFLFNLLDSEDEYFIKRKENISRMVNKLHASDLCKNIKIISSFEEILC